MATTSPPELNWTKDEHFRGQTVRIAFQLAGVDPGDVTAVSFAMEQESATVPVRVVVSLASSVPLGQSGVQLVPDPTGLQPPMPAGVTTYEAVVETAAFSMPSGWYRCDGWIDWPFGHTPVTAGRLHLREPALT